MTVDICITTDAKEMEGVCLIADLLARSKGSCTFREHEADFTIRWDGEGDLCLDREGPHCQDMGS